MFDAMPTASLVQIAVCIGLTAAVGLATWLTIRRASHDGSSRDVYLAGGKLSWLFVAGSITLTNLSTDQLVGMNGNQMLLLAWWEIAGFLGLMILAFVFVPIYYREKCTTVTELLEKRYGGRSIRTLISGLFLAGNVLIYLPAALYSGSLFMRALFGEGVPLLAFATILAVISAAYTIFGGLRAVAVMDTYSGVGILGLAMLIVVLGLAAVDWDIVTGVPAERLTMIGAADSPIPWQTLLTGMIFIQIFYWSTNQNLTQKAMAAPTIREAQKGVMVAAIIRILIVPPIVVIPGIIAFKLFGDIGDAAYGRLVAEILPPWLSGAFAAMVGAAVITTFSAVLNSSVALYAVDFHEQFIGEVKNHWRLSAVVSSLLAVVAIMLVPMYQSATSIINLLQQLNGLLSMPILSAFIAGLLFRGVSAPAAIAGVVWGVALYGLFTFQLQPAGIITLHYIHFMVVTLVTSIMAALAVNRFVLGGRAVFAPRMVFAGAKPEAEAL
ncbi:sodium:solute symporter family transporter [Erythrobacter sanguineus]|jgi:solute:Na+ symporter, SSS family|uniref:Solute:Na+ symporter, SSS family n=1 Tax=Erythrobacter sanguineus TaxID=198312 RepID=A0A1M7SNF9_9SPHN|nr:SLC5 family protein [Erythrobacter sanguineus]SHN59979.1 solute:Na+ symporter, SSS family [Erythrobacter sanguineus]